MATRSRSNFFGDFLFCEKKVTATGVGSHPEGDQKNAGINNKSRHQKMNSGFKKTEKQIQ